MEFAILENRFTRFSVFYT